MLAGKYRVERILGIGGMGVVVAAMHISLGRRVALKFLLPGKVPGAEQLERFLREARAAVRLKSRYVAQVLDVGTLDSGAPYLVLEYLDGQDLGAVLETRGVLPIADAVEYVLQASEAIAEAHAAGIVHRDLKPANLYLTTDPDGSPCVKVLDFGVSKMADSDLALTKEAQTLGSPLYMSPEQLKSSKDVDMRSDLWALGIILFELTAGKTPFHADSMQQLCARVLFGEPTPFASLRPDAPPGFEAVIAQCLEKDRERRWQTAADLAAALAPFGPPRAVLHAERIAAMLGMNVEPSRMTDLLPQDARSVSRPSFSTGAPSTTPSLVASAAPALEAVPQVRSGARAGVAIGIAITLVLGAGSVAGVLAWRGHVPASIEPSPSSAAPASPSATPALAPELSATTAAPPPSAQAPVPTATTTASARSSVGPAKPRVPPPTAKSADVNFNARK